MYTIDAVSENAAIPAASWKISCSDRGKCAAMAASGIRRFFAHWWTRSERQSAGQGRADPRTTRSLRERWASHRVHGATLAANA
jgi:hypothetical protein